MSFVEWFSFAVAMTACGLAIRSALQPVPTSAFEILRTALVKQIEESVRDSIELSKAARVAEREMCPRHAETMRRQAAVARQLACDLIRQLRTLEEVVGVSKPLITKGMRL